MTARRFRKSGRSASDQAKALAAKARYFERMLVGFAKVLKAHHPGSEAEIDDYLFQFGFLVQRTPEGREVLHLHHRPDGDFVCPGCAEQDGQKDSALPSGVESGVPASSGDAGPSQVPDLDEIEQQVTEAEV